MFYFTAWCCLGSAYVGRFSRDLFSGGPWNVDLVHLSLSDGLPAISLKLEVYLYVSFTGDEDEGWFSWDRIPWILSWLMYWLFVLWCIWVTIPLSYRLRLPLELLRMSLSFWLLAVFLWGWRAPAGIEGTPLATWCKSPIIDPDLFWYKGSECSLVTEMSLNYSLFCCTLPPDPSAAKGWSRDALNKLLLALSFGLISLADILL